MQTLRQEDGEQDDEPDALVPDDVPDDDPDAEPALDPEVDPEDIDVTHAPPTHDWPTVVQFVHDCPPVPHAVSSEPVAQVPFVSQQPPPQF